MFARKGHIKYHLVLLLPVLAAGCFVVSAMGQDAGTKPEQGTPKKIKPAQKALQGLISFEVIQPAPAKPGEVVSYTVKGKLKPEFYTYPITKKAPGQGQGTLLTVTATKDLQPLWPIKEKEPEFHYNEALNEVTLHVNDELVWSQDIFIKADATPGDKELPIKLNLQICKTSCYGPDEFPDPILVKIKVLNGPAVAVTQEIEKRLKQTDAPKVEVVTLPKEWAAKIKKDDKAPTPGATPGTTPTRTSDPALSAGLIGLLGSAFFGAILMLLTPCVFPMIPITVNFFLKQSEKEHHNALPSALVYSGTIVILLTIAMLTLGSVVIFLANNAWFNLALGAALIIFALSLFGMFEIELPTGLARFTSAREGQGGYAGVVFMALTFTITSFTCTGPFLGAMMGPVPALQPPFYYLVLAALVYSITFAAPFFLLALFPTLLKALPKSGGWLNSIKVTMGFLELAAALKFLSNTDIAWFPGDPKIFNYDTVLCAWIALSIACGMYLLGLFRLPHDDRIEHIGVVRMIFASIFLGLALYMFPLLRGDKPAGVVGDAIIAFLPPSFKEAPANGAPGGGELAWHMDYIDAWKEAVKEGKDIFIDFTGVNCTNCRYNEKNVFPRPDVIAQLKKYVRVQLYTDTVPKKGLSPAEAVSQAERNQTWRDAYSQGNPSNPTYFVFRPDPKEPFKTDGTINGSVVDARTGQINDVVDFVAFLKKPLEDQKVAKKVELDWHQDYSSAWRQAKKEGKLLLVHFASNNSTYARHNEVNVFQEAVVAEHLDRFVRVQLYIDKVPGGGLSAQESDTLAQRNLKWSQETGFGYHTGIAIVKPNQADMKTEDGLPDARVVESIGGMINDIPTFISLLKKSLAESSASMSIATK